MTKLTLLACALLFSLQCFAVEITKVPSAQSVADSHRLYNARLQLFIDESLHHPIGTITTGSFFEPILARILAGVNLHEVNDKILEPSTKPTGLVGTDFDGILGLCKRKGDYDFKLTELIPIVYEGVKRNSFSEAAYNKILSELLTEQGNKHQIMVKMGKCFSVPETENHILMIESARYLTNQLWNNHYPDDARFDNEKNGFNAWLLKHLQQFVKKDFEEYNSRPYQGHSVMPIMNLVSYAKDERVKLAATMVLDYLSAKFATQSSRLRRSAPISRQLEYSVQTNLLDGDHMTAFFAQIAGNTGIYKYNNPSGHITYANGTAFYAGVSSYRPDDLVLDMIINHDQVLEQRIRHNAVESYYRHPKFLVTAGGRYLNRMDAGMKKRDAWAYPTSIMSNTGNETDRTQLVRFDGANKNTKRNNMCQYKNFGCGMNLEIPTLPQGCLVDKGEWKFINYNSDACPLKYGYFVALRVKAYPKPGLFRKRVARDFGTFEVVDAESVSFDQFMQLTMQNNQAALSHKSGNVYQTFEGKRIEFTPGSIGLSSSPITKVDGVVPFSQNFLSGNIMTSKGDGRIVINNPKLGKMLILDYRNPLNPEKRILKSGL
ncbi:MAG TPA: hypothetical protein VNJ08_04060 [Bacteriovoracaceae bacterium]|nr:hypothetical protein [Bacteriovoracaceae bacterium]